MTFQKQLEKYGFNGLEIVYQKNSNEFIREYEYFVQ